MNNIFAIYIIDVTKKCLNTNETEYWQTFRRFNDFHDFHLLVKKRVNYLYFNLRFYESKYAMLNLLKIT
jgi:hypothetical protein